MSGSASSSSAAAAASSRKRAPSPAAAQSADVAAAPHSQPSLHSPIAPPPSKKARVDLPLDADDDRDRASAASAAPVSQRWSDLSPEQRCFSDGLALIFSFLSLFELIPAARACRSWREAGLKANVAGAELHNVVMDGWASGWLDGSARLQSLASSPFRRHVHELTHDDEEFGSTSDGCYFPLPEWTLLDLAMLQHLPQLRRISDVRVQLASALPDQALRFPPLLESVDLYLSFYHSLPEEEEDGGLDPSPRQRLVLKALRPCRSLTELSITLRPWTTLCLDGLQKLSALRNLTLDIRGVDEEIDSTSYFTEDHMRVVKQLPNLRRLTLCELDALDRWSDEDENERTYPRWLRWLCPPPHKLRHLQQVDLSQHFLQRKHMELLRHLPTLTALKPLGMNETALPLLPTFLRLRHLDLDFRLWNDEQDIDPQLIDEATGFARGPLLLPHLTPCAALTHLTLSEFVFTEAEAAILCQALPRLCALVLNDVGWPSFEALGHLPLLKVFSLRRDKTAVHPLHFDAAHFQPLQRLRDLTLIGVRPLTENTVRVIDALRPPSSLLPALVDFCFSP